MSLLKAYSTDTKVKFKLGQFQTGFNILKLHDLNQNEDDLAFLSHICNQPWTAENLLPVLVPVPMGDCWHYDSSDIEVFVNSATYDTDNRIIWVNASALIIWTTPSMIYEIHNDVLIGVANFLEQWAKSRQKNKTLQ
ncbi:hypothetical protein C8J56DRAFT_1061495 [Mycena floridula]|nr:hypothetical protein C8J56DRAFT_1061495 [Mycena floridula]